MSSLPDALSARCTSGGASLAGCEAGAGIAVYSPQNASFRQKYAGTNQELALQLVGGNGPGDRLRRSSQSVTPQCFVAEKSPSARRWR